MTKRHDLIVGVACALLVVLMWSTFQLLSRHAVTGTLTPYDLIALRFGVAGVLVLPLLAKTGWPRISFPRSLTLMVSAGLGFSALAYSGFVYAPAAHGGLIMPGSLPVWTAILGWLWLSDRPSTARLLGICAIVAGIALMGASSFDGSYPGAWRGDLLFVAASITWSIYTVAVRAWRIAALQAACIVSVLSAVIYLPFYWLLLPSGIRATPWWELIMQGSFQGGTIVLTLLAFTKAVSLLGPVAASMVTALVPAVTALAAIPVLGENLSFLAGAGIVVATLGMIGAIVGFRREK